MDTPASTATVAPRDARGPSIRIVPAHRQAYVVLAPLAAAMLVVVIFGLLSRTWYYALAVIYPAVILGLFVWVMRRSYLYADNEQIIQRSGVRGKAVTIRRDSYARMTWRMLPSGRSMDWLLVFKDAADNDAFMLGGSGNYSAPDLARFLAYIDAPPKPDAATDLREAPEQADSLHPADEMSQAAAEQSITGSHRLRKWFLVNAALAVIGFAACLWFAASAVRDDADEAALIRAPRCAGKTGTSCIVLERATVVRIGFVCGSECLTGYQIDVNRQRYQLKTFRGVTYPDTIARAGDQVQVTMWRGEPVSVTSPSGSFVTQFSPLKTGLDDRLYAFVPGFFGVLFAFGAWYYYRRSRQRTYYVPDRPLPVTLNAAPTTFLLFSFLLLSLPALIVLIGGPSDSLAVNIGALSFSAVVGGGMFWFWRSKRITLELDRVRWSDGFVEYAWIGGVEAYVPKLVFTGRGREADRRITLDFSYIAPRELAILVSTILEHVASDTRIAPEVLPLKRGLLWAEYDRPAPAQ